MRFFVDERSGIVAVRDRVYTDPDYSGLHRDTGGVVKAWDDAGYIVDHWELNPENVVEAIAFCKALNDGATPPDYNKSKRFICECGGQLSWEFYPIEFSVCNKCST